MHRYFYHILVLCGLAFALAIWGSADCGARLAAPALSEAEAAHLRHLIYFHFALAQLAVVIAALMLYARHRHWKCYYLIVCYNEKGLALDPPGIRIPSMRVYRCCLSHMQKSSLPPADGTPVLVYPMFMLSGHSSGAKLESALTAAYAGVSRRPRLFFQPVLGASPWLALSAAEHLRKALTAGTGILVVAHGSRMSEAPPEPALFCRRLRDLLPSTEVALGYFNQNPAALEVMQAMLANHVLLLPFLVTEGIHTSRDLPTAEQAFACGKTLHRLPVVGTLLTTDTNLL